MPCRTNQEAMHIHTVRVKSTAQPATHGAPEPLASGQRCTERQTFCPVSTHLSLHLYLHWKAQSNPHCDVKKHTHSHMPSPAQEGQHISIPICTIFRLSQFYIATHQTRPRWHLAVCARILLCSPICVGSKVMAGPGRGYRWADENSRGSV